MLAAYHASAYASRHFATVDLWKRYGARAHAWLGAHQTQALYLNAAAEIGTGFLLVIWVRGLRLRCVDSLAAVECNDRDRQIGTGLTVDLRVTV